MSRKFHGSVAAVSMAFCVFLYARAESHAIPVFANAKAGGVSFVIDVKHPKCSASTVEDFEGTDMSGATPKCQSTFDACVNEALACSVRLQKCKEFDKMDRDGSCYKKQR